jgi:hypothetical protein
LDEKLAATRAASAGRLPPELRAIMERATADMRTSGILDGVIKPGARAPAFSLADQNGQMLALGGLLATGAILLSVFRGFW